MKSSAEEKPEGNWKGQPPLNSPWQQRWLRLRNSHPSVQKSADELQAFAAAWFNGRPAGKLVLTGKSGCGKTQFADDLFRWANAVSFSAWERGHYSGPPSITYIYWPDACDRLEYPRSSLAEVLEDACEASLCIVDDIGAESDRFKSGKPTEAICYLLTRRQDRGHTMLTTNVPAAGWKAKWDARVEDRLLRKSAVVDMDGCPSWATI